MTEGTGAQAGNHSVQPGGRRSFPMLAIGAIGVVFGDIGTSPLYALRDTFVGRQHLTLDPMHLYGVISLMFWSMMLIVTIKYVAIIMRADNRGEGGSLALLALVSRRTLKRRWSRGIILLGVLATSLFYGDSVITPAVSVLGAVEGIGIYAPAFSVLIVPIAVAILVFLFVIQSSGTARVGRMFGPVMLLYFLSIATLGAISIVQTPRILEALSPHLALLFFLSDPVHAFMSLGTVVLAVTGAEALYSDMGHFGRPPIAASWMAIVLPALTLNYLGQGALLVRMGGAALRNPFFLLAPDWFRWPLTAIATCAAIIASQAVISGTFSVTQQAVQLGFMPRMTIAHTSETLFGQIYVPMINWTLMVLVILVVLFFESSTNLTGAYGIAVTGAMLIDTCLLSILLLTLWCWPRRYALPLLALFFIVDGAYFLANLTKVPDGGWLPLAIGGLVFVLLTTWSRGRALMRARMADVALPIEVFTRSATASAERVAGTAIFLASSRHGVPSALMHNIRHNHVLHERCVICTIEIADAPYVDPRERIETTDLGAGFYRIVMHFGFLEKTDVPLALQQTTTCGAPFDMALTSFFLSRQTLLPSSRPEMALWREKLFAWMLRNAANAMDFFKLPSNRVVELGSQVEF